MTGTTFPHLVQRSPLAVAAVVLLAFFFAVIEVPHVAVAAVPVPALASPVVAA